jgi:methyltransferase (TIGR00027 family)
MRENRASATALIVAAGVLRRSHCRAVRGLVAGESAGLAEAALRSAGRGWPVVRRLAASRWGASVAWFLERMFIPGLTMHYVLRKRAIEEAVRRGVGAGIRRVVILGAGLDGLGARLASEGVEVVEVDHPATQALKREALRGAGLGERGVRLVPADLSREFPEEVFQGGACIVVAEGLLMYLEPVRLRELVRGPARLLEPGSRLVMTFLERHGEEPLGFRNGTRLVSWWLRRRGEPFTWGIYPTRLKGLLRIAGFEMLDLIDHHELRQRYLRNAPQKAASLAIGEFIAVAGLCEGPVKGDQANRETIAARSASSTEAG